MANKLDETSKHMLQSTIHILHSANINSNTRKEGRGWSGGGGVEGGFGDEKGPERERRSRGRGGGVNSL
ncbi:unnamed protein product [Prunus armeniaca]